MPRRRFIDKKAATTFSLVYRSQDDPRIHDAEASDMVFTEKPDLNNTSRINKSKHFAELDEEFGTSIRDNEGEAANYGIYFDDSQYDYMQHMRDLGASGVEAQFIEAPAAKAKVKGKAKMKLEDALENLDIRSEAGASSHASSVASNAQSLFPEEMLPSEFVRPRTYQDQQDVPDAIAGFQPDMDPRLREVLEALDDEAYVDDDEDIFEALAQDGVEVDSTEWEHNALDAEAEAGLNADDDDDGWESDRTIKAEGGAVQSPPDAELGTEAGGVPLIPNQSAPPDDTHGDGDWMAEFSKFKQDSKAKSGAAAQLKQKRLDMQSSIITGASNLTTGGRHKKRKGALTSTSSYSMSSSVLSRTENQSILDARFEKIEEEYAGDDDNHDDDGASLFSGVSGVSRASTSSQAPQLVRSDFNAIMGEFLQNHSQVGKRRVRVGKPQTGVEQLDEIRKGLGPARLKTSSR